MDWVSVCGRLLLAAVFLVAAAGKALDREGSRRSMRDFRVPAAAVPVTATALPLLEAALGFGLLFAPTTRFGAALAAALLSGFIGGIALALRRGEAPDCHCFGQLHSTPAGRGTIVRNAGFLAVAIVVMTAPVPTLDDWLARRSNAELAVLALGALLGIASAVAFHLASQTRSLREQLAANETIPDPLPIGAPTPAFSARTLGGDAVSLEYVRDADRPWLLTFVSPSCGPCVELFPSLARWQRTLSQRLPMWVVTSGGVDDQQALATEHGLRNVLLEESHEVTKAFGVPGTPSAILIASDGTIASRPSTGVFEVESLIRTALR